MIEAKIIQASLNPFTGDKIVTYELDYPRFIHAEIMTHRMFSRNAQSSRAVPVKKTLEVNQQFVKPLVWGANKSGMSSTEELDELGKAQAESMWEVAAKHAFKCSQTLNDIGLHKQWSNRVTEPFSRIKVVVTATEYENFFWLRIDPDAAQPEIVELAEKMKDLYDNAEFYVLGHGEWHLPYINRNRDQNGSIVYYTSEGDELTLEDAVKISASCCAQVSYRKLDETKQKALEIYDRLFSGPKPHLSPVEHQAMCIDVDRCNEWPVGITHQDRKGNLWSGNLKGFVQYRQILQQA